VAAAVEAAAEVVPRTLPQMAFGACCWVHWLWSLWRHVYVCRET